VSKTKEFPMNVKTLTALISLGLASMSVMSATSSVDLSTYTLKARFALPEPTTVTPPANSLLAQEASGVTWNRDTNSLFVVGDGGTSVVQVSLTGQLINSMTLGQDASKPQGTAYYDPEGITYVGNGKFILVEERDRKVSLFTYAAGTTLKYADSQHVKLGTTIGNIGIEGISWDPLTGGIIAVKEKQPLGIFQTTLNFAAGTASNGSATTVNSTNLFNTALPGLLDFADVFALSNLSGIGAADQNHLLILSQESSKVVEVDRLGNVYSALTIPLMPGTGGLSVPDQQHEGMTMDDLGNLYIVNENGGGDINHPQLWVYSSTTAVPEPQTYALLLAGLTLVGSVARRKARKSA
jgi:uncharacterized protein YjiK